jgi:hypothetical protein
LETAISGGTELASLPGGCPTRRLIVLGLVALVRLAGADRF